MLFRCTVCGTHLAYADASQRPLSSAARETELIIPSKDRTRRCWPVLPVVVGQGGSGIGASEGVVCHDPFEGRPAGGHVLVRAATGWQIRLLWCAAVVVALGAVALLVWSVSVRFWLLSAVVAAVTASVTGAAGMAITRAQHAVGRLAGQQPVQITFSFGPVSADGYAWVARAEPDELHDVYAVGVWPPNLGYVLAHPYKVDILVEGRTAQAVVLRRLRAIVDGRRPATRGNYFSVVGSTGTVLDPRVFHVDLDADPPRLWPSRHQLDATPDFPYTVTQGDPEMFHIHVTALDADYDWHLELDWTAGGESGTYVLDDGGSPFSVAAVGSRSEFRYYGPGTGWRMVDGSENRAQLRAWREAEYRRRA